MRTTCGKPVSDGFIIKVTNAGSGTGPDPGRGARAGKTPGTARIAWSKSRRFSN